MTMIKRILNSFVFWGAWIAIPILMEVIPAIGSFILLLVRRHKYRRASRTAQKQFYPEISIIVPVYNSADTLYNCIKSIYDSTYPTDRINVFLVNNQGKDDSFDVFAACQEEFHDLHMQWMNALQGKSRALNLALYNSNGKYIINIDSDGMLEPTALVNLVDKFEADPKLNCMTGAILTTPSEIKKCTSFWGRLLRNLEYMEYAQAFLAGRSYASEINSVYTLSGAFSAFRKSAILKSRLYNTDTICEDTQLTFQMRQIYGERVEVCENALFLVDPIESVNKLYTQRQRWQRGSLEVGKMFMDDKFRVSSIFTNINVKTLLYDHTFAFPRMIWYLALICLMFMSYSGSTLGYSTIVLFSMYIVIGFFYFFTAKSYLKDVPELQKYYARHWYLVIILPFFNLLVFFIRLAGIINSIGTDSSWKTNNLTDEKNAFSGVVKEDFGKLSKAYNAANNVVNCDDSKKTSAPETDAESKHRKPVFWYVWVGLMIFAATLVIFAVKWVGSTYGVGFGEILSTLKGNVKGTGNDVIVAIIKGIVLPVAAVLILYIAYVIIDIKIFSKKALKASDTVHRLLGILSLALPIFAVIFINFRYDLLNYYELKKEQAAIYEDYYVDPDDAVITGGGRNVIFIYLESMETTYADSESGGMQTDNYIPNLTQIAGNNTSFSNTDKLGGFHTISGFGYTVSAIFGTSTGLPYKETIDDTDVYGGVTAIGDILEAAGYNQEFMCGSDATFGGREAFFKAHGNYDIFDLYTAREQGYIDDDYYVWWGFEDCKLFEMAKDEVTRLAAEDEPFNFTMLTVDTHHIGGYVCEECGSDYDVDTANVVACTDRLVENFVEWVKEQDFYENTTIVIVGDHPRMDNYLVEGYSYYDRTEYNCFINSAVDTDNVSNREFTTWDIFPTTLAAMGFEIEGDRLGLGTNLFSDKKTLSESKGFDWVQTEANKKSDYYEENFVTE